MMSILQEALRVFQLDREAERKKEERAEKIRK